MISFEKLCKMSQKEIKNTLRVELATYYNNIIVDDGFIFAKGTTPICLVAHMDTVHKETPRQFIYQDGKISSPQGIGGDDRCGIYAILNIIRECHCSVLFCEDEEIGGLGAGKFIRHPVSNGLEFNYMIELDRRGHKDAVFYRCDNPEFEEFITETGEWKTEFGSFSDISILAPKLKCAAVNLSCGYYKAHTLEEYVNIKEMENCITKVCALIRKTKSTDKFEYIEAKRSFYDYEGLGCYNGFNYDGYYGKKEYSEDVENYYVILYNDEAGGEDFEELMAHSDLEAIGMFMTDHPTLCVNDIIDIEDYGPDLYML